MLVFLLCMPWYYYDNCVTFVFELLATIIYTCASEAGEVKTPKPSKRHLHAPTRSTRKLRKASRLRAGLNGEYQRKTMQ